MKTFTLKPVKKKAIQKFCMAFSICLMSFNASSQCNVAILSNAMIVNTNITLVNGGEVVWVCSGVTVTDNGGADTAYLEQNCSYTSFGATEVIYAKTGCIVNLHGGSEIVYKETGATVNDIAGGATINNCSTLSYNYSNAPANGCAIQGIFFMENINLISVDLFPNPIISSFTLSIDTNQNFKQFTLVLYNVLGEEVKRVENITQDEIEIFRGKLQSGIYMYQLLSENLIVNSGKVIME